MNFTKLLIKYTPAYVTCALMITILTAPILSISLQPTSNQVSAKQLTALSAPTDSKPADVYFNPSEYDITNYSRDDVSLINRGADSEDLLFGAVDIEEDGQDIVAPEDSTFKEDNTVVYINVDEANVRKYPGLDAPVIAEYVAGDSLRRTGIATEWSRVVNAKGVEGYIKSDFLDTNKPKPTATPTPTPKPTTVPKIKPSKPARANTLGEAIAKEAKKYLGVRYRGGYADPSKGFDCSGFTSYVYSRYGIDTPRGTSSYYDAGIIIPYSQIAPGDIIAWDTRKFDRRTTITHVSMYIGGGMMIHASSSNHSVVVVSVAQYREWGCKLLSVHRFIKK